MIVFTTLSDCLNVFLICNTYQHFTGSAGMIAMSGVGILGRLSVLHWFSLLLILILTIFFSIHALCIQPTRTL